MRTGNPAAGHEDGENMEEYRETRQTKSADPGMRWECLSFSVTDCATDRMDGMLFVVVSDESLLLKLMLWLKLQWTS